MSSMTVEPTEKFTRDSCPIEAHDEASLEEGFRRVFHPTSCARVWLIYSVNRNIQAYRLSGVDAWDILTEAYLRAGEAIRKGKLIWNLVSWLKSTSSYIILEHKRRFARPDTTPCPAMDFFWNVDERLPEDCVQASFYADDVSHVLSTVIRYELSALECRLLLWRLGEELSWREVCRKLEANGEGPTNENEANLRKKQQRALQKLRRALAKYDGLFAGTTINRLNRREMLDAAHAVFGVLDTAARNK